MPIRAEILDQLKNTEEGLINQLIDDVSKIFRDMLNLEISYAGIVEVPEEKFKEHVTAMVGFAGLYSGVCGVHMSIELGCAFTGAMLGDEILEMNEDVQDALGEIANMVGGSFKHHLAVGNQEVRLSTPSIISGQDYTISVGDPSNTLTVQFSQEDKLFTVFVVLETE